MEELKILRWGYILLLLVSVYQNYNGYGALEMTFLLFCISSVIYFKIQREVLSDDN